jgi:Polyketide cyclase / dehydrase and lipid transport
VKVTAAVDLPLDAGSAWARLLQWERQPEWMVDAVSVSVLTTRRTGSGVRIAVRTRVLGRALLTDVLEIVEWDPPRRLVMERRGFVRGRGEWWLDPISSTSTRFTWVEDLHLTIPLLGEVALIAYRPFMRRLMRRSLSNLAAALR